MTNLTPREILLKNAEPTLLKLQHACKIFPTERSSSWAQVLHQLVEPLWVDKEQVCRCLATAGVTEEYAREMAGVEEGAPLNHKQIAELGGWQQMFSAQEHNLVRIVGLLAEGYGVKRVSNWSECNHLLKSVTGLSSWEDGEGVRNVLACNLTHFDDLMIGDMIALEHRYRR